MDEGQARNPNTTYNGYKMEFWKFARHGGSYAQYNTKYLKKEQKETTKKGGISLTIMGQRQTYNSEKLLFWKGDTKESDRIPAKKRALSSSNPNG